MEAVAVATALRIGSTLRPMLAKPRHTASSAKRRWG